MYQLCIPLYLPILRRFICYLRYSDRRVCVALHDLRRTNFWQNISIFFLIHFSTLRIVLNKNISNFIGFYPFLSLEKINKQGLNETIVLQCFNVINFSAFKKRNFLCIKCSVIGVISISSLLPENV